YLEAIDESCWYSNYGPLVTRLEQRLSRHLGLDDCVITTANATLGLTASLLARGAPEGALCLMPSWTFAATAHAARAARMIPCFHDVERETWALDPEAVMLSLSRISAPVGAVIVVSPFGAGLDTAAWQEFESKTGVRVVADGAAAFDTVRPCAIPTVVSLH